MHLQCTITRLPSFLTPTAIYGKLQVRTGFENLHPRILWFMKLLKADVPPTSANEAIYSWPNQDTKAVLPKARCTDYPSQIGKQKSSAVLGGVNRLQGISEYAHLHRWRFSHQIISELVIFPQCILKASYRYNIQIKNITTHSKRKL